MSDAPLLVLCGGLLALTGVAYYFHARTRPGRMPEMSLAWRLITPR